MQRLLHLTKLLTGLSACVFSPSPDASARLSGDNLTPTMDEECKVINDGFLVADPKPRFLLTKPIIETDEIGLPCLLNCFLMPLQDPFDIPDDAGMKPEEPRNEIAVELQVPDMSLRWVFGSGPNAIPICSGVSLGDWLSEMLTTEIRLIDSKCGLDEAQKAKLELAGRGDIHHFLRAYHSIQDRANAKLASRDLVMEFHLDCLAIRKRYESGFFGPKSLLVRSLRATLCPQQFDIYESSLCHSRYNVYRLQVYSIIARYSDGLSLKREQRDRLVDLIYTKSKTMDINRFPVGADLRGFVIRELSIIPSEEIKPIFTAEQWPKISQSLRNSPPPSLPPRIEFLPNSGRFIVK